MSCLGASHTKNFEILFVPLTQCGGTNLRALAFFLFPKIGHLPFFLAALLYVSFCQVSVGTRHYKFLHVSFRPQICVTENVHNIFLLVLKMIFV